MGYVCVREKVRRAADVIGRANKNSGRQAERETEWARKDSLARLNGMGLQVLDRMLRRKGDVRVALTMKGKWLTVRGRGLPQGTIP
jgi:hypothetical protein